MRAWLRLGVMLLGLGPACLVGTAAPEPAFGLKLGERATTNIVTPVRMVVADPDRTALLRRREARRTPTIYRYNSNALVAAESVFHAALDRLRVRFVHAVTNRFGALPVPADRIQSPEFAAFATAFQARAGWTNGTLNAAFFADWAAGASDAVTRSEWTILLRAYMRRYICLEALLESDPSELDHVWLLPADAPEATTGADLDQLPQRSRLVPKSQLQSLAELRAEVRRQFPSARQSEAACLASFLQPNCYPDQQLTLRFLKTRLEPIHAAREYMPGETIVAAGAEVDAAAQAALAQLQAHLALPRWRAEANRARDQFTRVLRENRGLQAVLVLLVLAVLLLITGLVRSRRRQEQARLPVLMREGDDRAAVLACPQCAAPIALPALGAGETWQARALRAEQRAEEVTALLKAGWLPLLGRWLKSRLVQGLLSQRQQAIQSQQQAASDLASLEKRLARLQRPLTEKLRRYENRIAHLEGQLAARDGEAGELTPAQSPWAAGSDAGEPRPGSER